jgi:hypothetical protein
MMENFNEKIKEKLKISFKEYEKTFTAKSPSIYFDDAGNKISLKEIYDENNILGNHIVLIAVTRNQYDLNEFPKYVDYIKNSLKKNKIYYGLWTDRITTDSGKVEYDVLYVIHKDNFNEIQTHLNSHDHMNHGNKQEMALVISPEGSSKIIKNKKLD